jgi:Tol biopolymer transport system component
LALRDTALVLDRVVGGDAVRPYDPSREPIGELGEAYLRGTWAAGGIVSTPSDLVRWSSALYRGRVLEPDSLHEMLDAKPDTEASCRRWGCSGPHTLGTETVIYASRMTWGHEGSSGAVIRYFPEGEIAIAILTNQVPEGTPGPGPALDAIIRTLGLEERADIYSMKADGTGVTKLTETPAVDGLPVAWSPDGQRILFGSARDGNQEVYVMRADGTEERRLTTNATRDTGASWTHDGRIVFSSEREGPTRLYVMDSDGSNAQPLPGSAPGDAFPVVSPDGRRIAFATGPADNLDLVVMGLDGTQRTIVAGGPGSQWWASWSPDGSRIVFADETAEKFRIAVVGSDGSHRSFVPVESARWPAWSPNGRLIAFVRDKGDIVAVAPDGSGARLVARDPIWAFGPSWSPDGSQIAFASSRS